MNKELINPQTEDDNINLRTELEKYLVHWRWFVFSLVLSLIGAYLFIRYVTPEYKAVSTVLIKDKESGASNELAAFQDFGIIGKSGKNINNEIQILKSRKIIGDMIKRLNLNFSYLSEGRINKSEVYDKSPIRIKFLNDSILNNNDKIDTIIEVHILSNTSFELYNDDGDLVKTCKFGEPIKSQKLGFFKIDDFNLTDKNFDANILITIKSTNKVIDYYRDELKVAPINEEASVLEVSIKSAVKLKSENIVDELIERYNQDAIDDKRQISQKTKDFVVERLSSVGKELSIIDNDVKNFKTKNKLTDIVSETKLLLENSSRIQQEIIATNTQLSLVKSLNEEMESPINDLLPANLGLDDVNIGKSISSYNELILKKNRLLKSAGIKNSVVINAKERIQSIKNSLSKSLQNKEKSLNIKLNQLNKENSKFDYRVSSVPVKEKKFIDIKREQQIKANLYSYLLKKKEETDISLAVTTPNAKIIDKAYSSDKPVFPNKIIVVLAGFLFGVLIPFIVIYFKNLFDTKVHTREDIEKQTNIPFLGDIPRSKTKEKITVNIDDRSSVAEAFRLVRTNLNFMSSKNAEGKGKVIFTTSTISEEGKSFVSINLAISLALLGKKTLLIGMDLRAPKIIEYLDLPDIKGVTNFITDDSLSLEDLKFEIPGVKNLKIITSGVIPPNPSELLMNERVAELFDLVRQDYDYILVDTAPVSLVTDTMLIAKYADVSLYIIRANHLDKRMLSLPRALYNEGKLPNMAVILNGVDARKGYGYGYGYGIKNKKPWYKKIIKS